MDIFGIFFACSISYACEFLIALYVFGSGRYLMKSGVFFWARRLPAEIASPGYFYEGEQVVHASNIAGTTKGQVSR